MANNKSIIAKTKTLLIVEVIFFIMGAISLIGFYFSLTYNNIFLSPGSENPSLSIFLAGMGIALIALIITQIVFYRTTKKIVASLSESNEEILENVTSLKGSKDDEIKELVTTRNMLLMKLENNKKEFDKLGFKIKNKK